MKNESNKFALAADWRLALASLLSAALVVTGAAPSLTAQDFCPARALGLRQGNSPNTLANGLMFYAILDTTNYDASSPSPWKDSIQHLSTTSFDSFSCFQKAQSDDPSHPTGLGSGYLLLASNGNVWQDWPNPWTNSSSIAVGTYTIVFWIKYAGNVQLTAQTAAATAPNNSSNNGWQFLFYPNVSNVFFYCGNNVVGDTGAAPGYVGPSTYPTNIIGDGVWHQVAAGFDAALFNPSCANPPSRGGAWLMFDGGGTLYLADASTNWGNFGASQAVNGGVMTFGNWNPHPSVSTIIELDDFGIWNRRLTPAEVAQLFANRVGNRPPGI